jgi:hypothetical protein
MCTRSMNLGCFCVDCFDGLTFSPFMTKTVAPACFVWPMVTDASLLMQSACHGRYSGRLKKRVG